MRIRFGDGAVISTEVIPGQRRRYYLVRDSDRQRFFISRQVDQQALEQVCKRHLSDQTGWNYWIDLSLGLDVRGNVAWVNLDQTDRFIP